MNEMNRIRNRKMLTRMLIEDLEASGPAGDGAKAIDDVVKALYILEDGDAEESESLLKKPVSVLESEADSLEHETGGQHRKEAAELLIVLGRIYRVTEEDAKSENCFSRALDILRQDDCTDRRQQMLGIADACGFLAGIYADADKKTDAEAYYREALDIDRRLAADTDNEVVKCRAAQACHNASEYFAYICKTREVEPLKLEAIGIMRELAVSGSADRYEPDFAAMCCSLAAFYAGEQLLDKALPLYQEAFAMFRKIAGQKRACSLGQELALTFDRISGLYLMKKNPDQAETSCAELLEFLRGLTEEYDRDEDVFGLALTCSCMARIKEEKGIDRKSGDLIDEAIDLYKESADLFLSLKGDSDPAIYDYYAAETYMSLAELYADLNEFVEAENAGIEAAWFIRGLADTDNEYMEPLASVYIRLGNILAGTKDKQYIKAAKEYYSQALNVYYHLIAIETGESCERVVWCWDHMVQTYDPELEDWFMEPQSRYENIVFSLKAAIEMR